MLSNLLLLEPAIREHAGTILNALPAGKEIDWVQSVWVELTTMTLATLQIESCPRILHCD